jgi:hypothetical protein
VPVGLSVRHTAPLAYPTPTPRSRCRASQPCWIRASPNRPPPPAGDSPTHANPTRHPVAAGEAARASRLAHTNSAISRLSTRPLAAALDFRQRTCDEQRSSACPPNISMTTVANPADGPDRPASRNHNKLPTTNQTMAINPYPLTPTPPYGRLPGLSRRRCEVLCSRRHGHLSTAALPGASTVAGDTIDVLAAAVPQRQCRP